MQCSIDQGRSLLNEMIEREPTRLAARIERIIRDQASAEDLAQETLLRALHGLSNLRAEPVEPLMCAWLDRIARNLAYNYVRDRNRRPDQVSLDARGPGGAEPMAARLAGETPDPAAAVAIDEATAHLVALVQALPRPLKQVFLLRELEELSTTETARLLGIQEGLVKWRLHKARQILRTRLQTEP